METWKWVVSGIIATTGLTLLAHGLAYLANKRWQVVRILATMLFTKTGNGKLTQNAAAITFATIVHYFVGILFSLLYAFLWGEQILEPTFMGSLLFGVCIGIFAIAVWRAFLATHPRPPHIPVSSFLFVIMIGHWVFALLLYVSVNLFMATAMT